MISSVNDQLEIEEDLSHEKREWRVLAIGRIACLVFLASATVGLCGPGPLSRTSASAGGLEVYYERFGRFGRETPIRIVLDDKARPGNPELAVWLAESLISSLRIEEVVPEPLRSEQRSGRLTLVFQASDPGPVSIRLHGRPEAVGIAEGEIGLVGGPSVTLRQTVFP